MVPGLCRRLEDSIICFKLGFWLYMRLFVRCNYEIRPAVGPSLTAEDKIKDHYKE